ncbi:MAG: alpha/beta hydrolase [Pseudomonadota bacterium]
MTSLVQFDSNPGPQPHAVGLLETIDGFMIRYAVFRTEVHPCKGSIILLQGRNECIEKYAETASDLNERGFDVVSFDWRGQGGSSRFFSDRRRGHIDSFEQYAEDLDLVFTEVALPECRAPFYILAHSTGALVALYAAPNLNNRIQRMMLCSPFLGIGDEALSPAQVTVISGIFSFLGLGNMHMGGNKNGIASIPFETNRLTTSPERYARNREILDPKNGLGLGSATAGWLSASMKAVDYVRNTDHMAQIHIPILLINAGADRVVSTSAIEDYAGRIRSGAVITIDGARHELMQEDDRYREQLFAAFDAFIPGTN